MAEPGGAAPSARALHEMIVSHGQRAAERAAAMLGAPLNENNLDAFLHAPGCLRYKTTLHFDAAPLETHQFAQPVFDGPPEARTCRLCIHPRYGDRPDLLPLFLAYMTPAINYGEAATPDLCEGTASILLRLPVAEIRARLIAAMPD